MSLTKLSLLSLVVLLLVGVGWLWQDPSGLPLIGARNEAPPAPTRRGDDPTYAEELTTMSALLQQMRFELKQQTIAQQKAEQHAERQLKETTQRIKNQAQQQIDQLNQQLRSLEQQRAAEQAKQATARAASQSALAELRRERPAPLAARPANAEPATSDSETTGESVPDTESILEKLKAQVRGSQGNQILNADPAPAEPTSGRPTSAPHPSEPADSPPINHSALAYLRGIPGMETLADSLTAKNEAWGAASQVTPSVEAPSVKTPPGLNTGYVTIAPYHAVGVKRETPVRRAHYPNAIGGQPDSESRLHLPAYPFELETEHERGVAAVIPVYTIPQTATLIHNTTMTALVGRVPVRGAIRDPFRFKLITGRTNLATNGHTIPGIAQAVWTGYATGLREQACVRAYVDTVTFIFQDGRIHTVTQGQGQTDPTASVNDHLGVLTDPRGNPCIAGTLLNNAGDYLGSRGFAAFLDGIAKAYARSQVTIERSGDGILAYVEGDVYEYAAAQGVSGATGEIADYVRERAAEAFDVVYVPTGVNVSLHIETEIPIDYQTDGRRLHYDYSLGGSDDRLD